MSFPLYILIPVSSINKHNEIKWGLIPHSYYNIPTKIYKSFYQQNTEKFLDKLSNQRDFGEDVYKNRQAEGNKWIFYRKI